MKKEWQLRGGPGSWCEKRSSGLGQAWTKALRCLLPYR